MSAKLVCGACAQDIVDANGKPRTSVAHSCLACKKSLHSYVVCSAVHQPSEGAYFCSPQCERNLGRTMDDDMQFVDADADVLDVGNGIEDDADAELDDALLENGGVHDGINNEGTGNKEQEANDARHDAKQSDGGSSDTSTVNTEINSNDKRNGALNEQMRKMLVEGQRIRMAFKQDRGDSDGSWWGGTVGPYMTGDGTNILISFDDGDLSIHSHAELAGLYDMGKFELLPADVKCGLVNSNPVSSKALGLCPLQVAKKVFFVGVLLGDGVSTLCKHPLYNAHVLCQSAWESATKECVGSRPQPVRSCSRTHAVESKDDKHGFQTFHRGNMVEWSGGGFGDVAEVGNEVVYGLLVTQQQKQLRRFIITFCEKTKSFAVNAWTSWQTIPVSSEAGDNELLSASSEVVDLMVQAWSSDPLSHIKSIDQLQKASLLGPASVTQKRAAEKRELERKRKLQARKRKLEQDKRDKQARLDVKKKQREAELNQNKQQAHAEATKQRTPPTIDLEAVSGNLRHANRCSKQWPPDDDPTLNINFSDEFDLQPTEVDTHKKRADVTTKRKESVEEMQRRIEAEEIASFQAEKEMQLRNEIRARLRAEARQTNQATTSTSPKESTPASWMPDKDAQYRSMTPPGVAPTHPPQLWQPVLGPMFHELMQSIHDLRRKIVRLEGEQRVHRDEHREGELETLRFDLHQLQRCLSRYN